MTYKAKYFTDDPKSLGFEVLYGASNRKFIKTGDVKNALEKSGLDCRIKAPSYKLIIKRTMNEVLSIIELDKKWIVMNINNKKFWGKIIYRQDGFDSTGDIIFKEETKIKYDKSKEKFIVEGGYQRSYEKIYKVYSENLIGNDIRKITKDIVKRIAIKSLRGGSFVRDAGGVYFVPRDHIEVLESLRDFLVKLRVGYVRAFAIVNGKYERDEIFISAIIYYGKLIEFYKIKAFKILKKIKSLKNIKLKLVEISINVNMYVSLTNRRSYNKKVLELNLEIDLLRKYIDEKINQIKIDRARAKKDRNLIKV